MLRNLTKRQTEVYNWVIEGLSIKEMAERKGSTVNGVKFHLTKIYKKFGVSNRVELLSKVLWLQEQKKKEDFQGLPMPKNTEVVINAE